MKIYRLNDKWNETFEDEQSCLDYLEDYCGITFDNINKLSGEQICNQAELKMVLLETYFTVDHIPDEDEETEFDYYFDKGFHPERYM